FDSPFEFGMRYQLAGYRQVAWNILSPQFLWFNFRVYFLEPARWSARFPFVHEIFAPRLPAGYERVESPFGVLTNIPLVWLALAVPLAWRGQSRQAGSILHWFVGTVALYFVTCVLTLGFFRCAIFRYEADFLPALLLLAVVGILGLERALAGQTVGRRVARWGWSLLLLFSVAFNLLASVQVYANERWALGTALAQAGRVPEAIHVYEEALRLTPDSAELHNNCGFALVQLGQVQEAIRHWELALRIKPDFAEAHCNLGLALEKLGRTPEAIQHYQQALKLRPDFAPAKNALARLGAGQ
ncbi:MAG: tetratricopeptide repeat protein, partial [Verrucomicrobiia bacterium]